MTGREETSAAAPVALAPRCAGPTPPGPRRWWQALRWYVRGVTGADAYDKYLVWARRSGVTPMSERDFWRDQTDRQEHDPQARCC